MEFYRELKNTLSGTDRLAILGIGSELRGDDAAGIEITRRLAETFNDPEESRLAKLRIYHGCSAPENYTGAIKAFKPTHLILIDAADLGEIPGSLFFIDPQVIGGVSFSTHMMPLNIFTQYLEDEVQCKVIIIGIQPEKLDFTPGASLTPIVEESVTDVVNTLSRLIIEEHLNL
ncbi:MAG: hydrogenase maturation peptidase HycI [Candidatus Omnitrophota bacterium]